MAKGKKSKKQAKKPKKTKKVALPTKHIVHIVKRFGHCEHFDERKLYASVYNACMSCHYREITAEDIAAAVTKEVKQAIAKKKQVESKDIFKLVISILEKMDKDVAFMYETHRDIS